MEQIDPTDTVNTLLTSEINSGQNRMNSELFSGWSVRTRVDVLFID